MPLLRQWRIQTTKQHAGRFSKIKQMINKVNSERIHSNHFEKECPFSKPEHINKPIEKCHN